MPVVTENSNLNLTPHHLSHGGNNYRLLKPAVYGYVYPIANSFVLNSFFMFRCIPCIAYMYMYACEWNRYCVYCRHV